MEGDTIEFAIDTAPSNGTLNPNTASWFDGQFDYTPNQDFNGTDTILVKALSLIHISEPTRPY